MNKIIILFSRMIERLKLFKNLFCLFFILELVLCIFGQYLINYNNWTNLIDFY